MPHADVVVRLARDVLDELQFQEFMGLMALRESTDRQVRAAAEEKLLLILDQVIENATERKQPKQHLKPVG